MRELSSWFARGFSERRQRRCLAQAALDYVEHGWPVIPGAWWSATAGRHVCDIPGCVSGALHPAAIEVKTVAPMSPPANLADYALVARSEIVDRWRQHPYTILLPTGIACDVIEAPVSAVLSALPRHDAAFGPVAYVDRIAYIFVRISPDVSGTAPISVDSPVGVGSLMLHGAGSWVPLPPSTISGVGCLWWLPAAERAWQLPCRDAVLDALAGSAE